MSPVPSAAPLAIGPFEFALDLAAAHTTLDAATLAAATEANAVDPSILNGHGAIPPPPP
jgi:hypothetical protein